MYRLMLTTGALTPTALTVLTVTSFFKLAQIKKVFSTSIMSHSHMQELR